MEISKQSYTFGKLTEVNPISMSDVDGKFFIENLRYGEVHLLFSYVAENNKNDFRVDLAKENGTIYFKDVKNWKLVVNIQDAFENSFEDVQNNKEVVVYLPTGKKYITVR